MVSASTTTQLGQGFGACCGERSNLSILGPYPLSLKNLMVLSPALKTIATFLVPTTPQLPLLHTSSIAAALFILMKIDLY